MNIAQAKCIPIADYLARQGHEPKHTRMGGRELWYHSPIREGDENPSFKVDTIKNVWCTLQNVRHTFQNASSI